MSERPSVLIGFTPTHLIPMLEIARVLPGPVWLFHPNAERIPLHMRGGFRFLGGCDHAHWSRVRKYISAGMSLRSLLKPGMDAIVCVPHPFNPLSNFAYFAAGTAEARIYQDGILNYYDAANPFVDSSVLWQRRLKAAMALLPFRPYPGHLSGIDARDVSVGYFTHPELAVNSERFAQLTHLKFDASLLEDDRSPTGEPVVLFLDQPIERFMSPEAALLLREQAIGFADSLGRPVIYKPHYTQAAVVPRRSGWRMVSSREAMLPAEEIPALRSIETVVSFFSSALANIRLARPSVRCIAVGSGAMPVRIGGRSLTMADLFRSLDVETMDP